MDNDILENIEEYTGWICNSPDKANWAVGKVKEARARRDLFIQAAQAQIERLMEQISSADEKCNNETAFFLMQLDEYLDSVPARKTKTQMAFDLPDGTIVRKFGKKDFNTDKEKLAELLKDTEYVKTVSDIKWKELKADLTIIDDMVINTKTGEAIEGVLIVDKPAVCDISEV